MKRRRDLIGKTPYVDTLTNLLMVFMLLWAVSTAVEKAKKKQLEDANIRTDGIYAIVMEWPDDSNDDVDLYVRDPVGKIAFFSSRDVGLMHLEHDDQGMVSDQVSSVTGQVTVEKNEERVILRGAIAGEYTVNIHMYDKRGPKPTQVDIRMVHLKGEDAEVVKKTRTITRNGDEQTAFRFTLDAAGAISGINEMRRSLLGPSSPGNGFPGGP